MRRWLAVALAVAGAFGAPAPAGALDGDFAPYTTRIAVKLTDRLSSATAHPGDTFDFVLTGSVAVDGFYLAARTLGRGVVTEARPAAGSRPGVLTLEARSVDLPDGHTLGVSLDASSGPEQTHERDRNVTYDKDAPFIVLAPPPQG